MIKNEKIKRIINSIYYLGNIAEIFWKTIFLILSIYIVKTILINASKWDLLIEFLIAYLIIFYLFKLILDLFKKEEFFDETKFFE